ncbi:TIGR02269 family lipoprotein [Pyxidicoccus parkwayensis]|uniref:TIGR02269 family lipoprotein n=1 Tax=Pyxidicoccus parkwayensis TaxID=2813578 RepID=A0ABX7P8D6_9BACT|nr:TIGR02269 family lipoprotein [Pyxidicoccus parkwaysis]QSQ26768.1 TIGR02269 family lipoprotein [Pyxidicoccus parkwaysis]
MRLCLLLLVAALQACATTAAHSTATYDSATVWDAAGVNDDECESSDDDRCLVSACTPVGCGLYRCEDLAPGRIVRARGVSAVRPPADGQRNWGNAQALPGDALPVMTLQWYRDEELPSQKEFERRLDEWRKRPHERHHVFPQALADYFRDKGINVHDWVMVIDAGVHARLHREADRGPWNTEWKEWRKRTRWKARKHEHFESASYLIQKYNLWGLPVTYWQTLPPLPPP